MTVSRCTGANNGDLLNAANWSNGVPSDTVDELQWVDGDRDFDINLDLRTTADVDPRTVYVGGTYTGSIGTPSTPMKLKAFDAAPNGEIRIATRNTSSQVLNFDVTSCPQVVVERTGINAHAFYLSAGTVPKLFIKSGVVRIGPGAVITKLRVRSVPGLAAPKVYIEAGAQVTLLVCTGGQVTSEIAPATVRTTGAGVYKYVGSAAPTWSAIQAYGTSRVLLQGGGGTVTDLDVDDGALVDSETDATRAVTYTNATIGGGRVKAKAIDAFTNDADECGGELLWTGSRKTIYQGNSA